VKQTYFFKKPVGPSDWSALPRAFLAGEIVEKFMGHTYGLDRDDMMYGDRETIPCTCDGREGFFTVPVEMLENEAGQSPMGAYTRIPRPSQARKEGGR
jgi:hypothetical protein